MKWKKILTWCLIAIIFNMLLLMTISAITENKLKKILGSQLDENHNAIQKFYKKFLEFNSSLTMMRSVINRISYFQFQYNMKFIFRLKKESQIFNIDSDLATLNSTLFNLNYSHAKFERKIENDSKKFNQVYADINSNMEKIQNKNVEMSSGLSDFKSSQTLFEEQAQEKYDIFEQSMSDLEFDMDKMKNRIVGITSDISDFKSSQTLFEDEVQDKYDMFNQSLSDLEFEIMEKLESIRDEMAKNSSEAFFVEEYNNEMFNRSQNAP